MKTHITTASLRRSILAAGILGLTAITSHAAVVVWGGATNITGDSDVSTAGTLVGALNLGDTGVASATVNGVTFTGVGAANATTNTITSGNFTLAIGVSNFGTSNTFSAGAAPFSSLSAPYRALLSSAIGDGTTPFTLTMSGLVTGQTYRFEWWTNDSIAAVNFITTATAGGVVALGSNTTAALGGVGQFAIGTFIADATTQQVITFAEGGGGSDILNGFQLRQVAAAAVPEPGSALAGMLALGVCLSGLGKRSRRQTAEA